MIQNFDKVISDNVYINAQYTLYTCPIDRVARLVKLKALNPSLTEEVKVTAYYVKSGGSVDDSRLITPKQFTLGISGSLKDAAGDELINIDMEAGDSIVLLVETTPNYATWNYTILEGDA